MHESLFIVEPTSEADIFEDLSRLLKTFKKILELTSRITELIEDQEVSSLLQQLKSIPQEENSIAIHYDFVQSDDNPHRHTVHRFLCRLYQTLTLAKNQFVRRNESSPLLREFLNKVERGLSCFHKDRNIGSIFLKVFNLTSRFCLSVDTIVNQGFREEIVTYFKEEQNVTNDVSPEKFQPCKTESHFHKNMKIVHKGFSTLKCLDLDFESFKNSFFRCKNQNEDLYRETLHRNALIWKEIFLYSKKFSEYLRKKDKAATNRKNRLLENMHKMNSLDSEPQIRTKKETKNIQLNFSLVEPREKESELPSLNKSFKEDKNSSKTKMEGRKTHYALKNVLLTLNKVSNISPQTVEKGVVSPKKSTKEKWNKYSSYKKSKFSMKNSKREYQPSLNIKNLNSKEYNLTLDSPIIREIDTDIFKTKRHLQDELGVKTIAGKKCNRIDLFRREEVVNAEETSCSLFIIE